MTERYHARYLSGITSVLVGVSGGPDSLCLLDLVRKIPSLEITAAYFNHGLRPEAISEAEFVSRTAMQAGLSFVSGAADVNAFAGENGLSLEEAARLLRYRFLFEQARERHASAVAVGHTADDQVETILMHFLRGAGLAGLKGMAGRASPNEFDRNIPLVRPILHLWRYETETYCREHDLQPVHDATNDEEAFFRNRLRHSLIPELEKYNPRFKQRLLHTADALSGDYEIVEGVIAAAWSSVVGETGPGFIAFKVERLNGLTKGLLRNIIRRGMETLKPDIRNLDFDTLERAAEFIAPSGGSIPGSRPRQVDLIDGMRLMREGDRILLATLNADLTTMGWPQIIGVHELAVNQENKIDDTTCLSVFEVDSKSALQSAQENRDPFIAWMDAEAVVGRLTVRTRTPGDRIQPYGLGGHSVKLSDFFVNVKLPERARGKWPLVVVGDEIAWIPGFRLAHPYRISEKTRRALQFIFQKK